MNAISRILPSNVALGRMPLFTSTLHCAGSTGVIDKLLVYPENMQRNLDRLGGLVHSQRVLAGPYAKGNVARGFIRCCATQRHASVAW